MPAQGGNRINNVEGDHTGFDQAGADTLTRDPLQDSLPASNGPRHCITIKCVSM
jgi:hypothetical protein